MEEFHLLLLRRRRKVRLFFWYLLFFQVALTHSMPEWHIWGLCALSSFHVFLPQNPEDIETYLDDLKGCHFEPGELMLHLNSAHYPLLSVLLCVTSTGPYRVARTSNWPQTSISFCLTCLLFRPFVFFPWPCGGRLSYLDAYYVCLRQAPHAF